MPFQTSIRDRMGAGIPGELAFHSPHRATSAMLASASAANNVFGRFFTVADAPANPNADAIEAQAGGTGAPLGFLANPKEHVLVQADGFTPSLTLPNGVVASFVNMGHLFVQLSNAANPGDHVAYATATGILTAVAPGDAAPAGNVLIPSAVVDRYDVSVTAPYNGLAVIRVTDPNLATAGA